MDLAPIADRFARWLSGNPADVGATAVADEEYIGKGRLEAPPDGGAGNGAAMRVLGRALHARKRKLLSARGRAGAYHPPQPLSDAACVSVGRMIQRAFSRAPAGRAAAAEELCARHPEFLPRRV